MVVAGDGGLLVWSCADAHVNLRTLKTTPTSSLPLPAAGLALSSAHIITAEGPRDTVGVCVVSPRGEYSFWPNLADGRCVSGVANLRDDVEICGVVSLTPSFEAGGRVEMVCHSAGGDLLHVTVGEDATSVG